MYGFGSHMFLRRLCVLFLALVLTAALPALAQTASPAPTDGAEVPPLITPSPYTAFGGRTPEVTGQPEAAPTEAAPAETAEPEATARPVEIEALEAVDSDREDDGVIRVRLLSLGAVQALNITFAGTYAVEGDPGFRFDRDTQITLFEHEGSVWLYAGGLNVDMGSSLTLTRHETDGDTNGLYMAESEKPNIYNGDLSVTADAGALRAVLSIDIEEYLCGVVAYEMSDSFPIEALKAQAVAARTYAMQRKYAAGGRDYDLVDTTADQVFKGFDSRYRNVVEAVEATRGVVGVYNEGFATCYYTASNGGEVATPNDVWGSEADFGYITRHDDPFDLENPNSMVSTLSFAADLSDQAQLRQMVTEALDAELTQPWELVQVADVRTADAKPEGSRMYRTLEMDVTVRVQPEEAPEEEEEFSFIPGLSFLEFFTGGTVASQTEWEERTVTVSLDVYGQIKDGLSLGLNGSDYELLSVVPTQTGYTLEMRRFGHGTGMSQRGAQRMAGAYGYTWQEILAFYYPGMSLERIQWDSPALTGIDDMPSIAGYARPAPTPTPPPAPLPALEDGEHYATVTASTLNIRERPTTSSMVIDRFDCGRQLIVCSEPDADGWVAIRTAELEGYVKAEYLKE